MMILTLLFTLLAAPIDTGLADSDNPAFTYSGAWATQEFAYAIGGTARTTSSTSASVSFEVYSDGFTVFFLYGTSGTDMDVCIDEECVTVETAGAAARGRADFTELNTSRKAVTIQPADPLTGSTLAFDGVYIHPSAPDVDTSNLESQFTFEGVDYTGNFSLSLSAGEVTITLLLIVLILVQLVTFISGIWE